MSSANAAAICSNTRGLGISVRGKAAERNLLVSIGIFTTTALGPRVLNAILTPGDQNCVRINFLSSLPTLVRGIAVTTRTSLGMAHFDSVP
ncbi:hypothetical protein D3C84_654420 [compost metagenome]